VNLSDSALLLFTLEDAVACIRSRRFSALEYCDACIDQCERTADLNAFSSQDWERLRRDARRADQGGHAGLLAGVPLALKDNINTVDLTTSAGTGALKGFRAASNAGVAAALFAEGALLGAKANMHELAFGITTNNAVTGASRNPYDRNLIPGGSSGGTAVAVAARMMPAGIGTDTGGSVRVPAALCGIVGFRPSVGRYSGQGIVPISRTRDTAGPMTRNVADAVLIDAVLAGETRPLDPISLGDIRIGLPKGHFFDDLDPEVAAIVAGAIDTLAKAGATLIPFDIADVAALNDAVSFPVALYEFKRDLTQYLRDYAPERSLEDIVAGIGSADVKGVVESQMGSEAMPEAVYLNAMGVERPRLQQVYETYFRSNRLDAALFPTTPLQARGIGEDETVELNGRRLPTFTTYIRNTDPGSNAGIPGISIPAGLTRAGLPVGIELDGAAGSDRSLLAVADAIQQALGFSAAPPCVPLGRL
jgi:Asp-tRNA(Asn)/Glu-tRNA(Gln) amidotransferase A subunit family amidase